MGSQLIDDARNRGITLDLGNARNLEAIDRYGWAVVMVAPKANESFPTFAYTIGLSALAGSELIIVGLDPFVAARILNSIAKNTAEGGSLQSGPLADVLEGDYVVDLRPVDSSRYEEYLGRLLWFHDNFGREPLRVMQVVWPDKQGRYPDESEVSEDDRRSQLQPLLDQPVDPEALGIATNASESRDRAPVDWATFRPTRTTRSYVGYGLLLIGSLVAGIGVMAIANAIVPTGGAPPTPSLRAIVLVLAVLPSIAVAFIARRPRSRLARLLAGPAVEISTNTNGMRVRREGFEQFVKWSEVEELGPGAFPWVSSRLTFAGHEGVVDLAVGADDPLSDDLGNRTTLTRLVVANGRGEFTSTGLWKSGVRRRTSS